MAGPEFLCGERVSLRAVEEEDLAFVRDNVNDPRVWKSVGGQYTPTNLAMERKFFEDASRDESVVQFVVTVPAEDGDDERVGVVELDPVEWDRSRAQVAFWVAPDHRASGFGRDALSTLVRYAFDQLGLHKLAAEAFASNQASRGLLESVGFVEEGRLREEEWIGGEWVDVVRYGLVAGEKRAGGD